MVKLVKRKNRKKWFGAFKQVLTPFVPKPQIIYLGEKIKDGSIVLCNHVGNTAPLVLEMYCPTKFRFWGTHEMNENFALLYEYQSRVFYHQKQHWNLANARAFCLIASPLTYLFYRGLNLISTYRDARLITTMHESFKTIQNGQSLVIFPEDSSEGYLDKLKRYFAGFAVFANACLKKGIDIPIYVTYYRKKDNKYIVDKPVMFSKLVKNGYNRDKIAQKLCDRTNKLAKLQF